MSTLPFPESVFSGSFSTSHCQGIAVDEAKGYIYYSFTTAIIKTDLSGNLIGSAYGLLGHLGCIGLCKTDGKLYGSLEYKNDCIGKSILERAGVDSVVDGFYVVIIDTDKLNRPNMDVIKDGIMTAVYLKEVVDDYTADVTLADGSVVQHKYGCSGIDGLSIAPLPGSEEQTEYVFVAYGIYGDVNRTDNDYQILLAYERTAFLTHAIPLSQNNMHCSGPASPDHKYFVYTGNTCFGIQNLEYDSFTGNFLAAVYPGQKSQFPNPPMFVIDGNKAAVTGTLNGVYPEEEGEILSLDTHGIQGIPCREGATGLYSFGNGFFAVSHSGHNEKGHYTIVKPYEWRDNMLYPVSFALDN